MSFFESTIVRDEIEQITKLGDQIADNIAVFSSLPKNEMLKRIEVLQDMLDKTKIFCTRLSLSDDKEAIEMNERVKECAETLGKQNIMEALNEVQMLIYDMKNQLDKQ